MKYTATMILTQKDVIIFSVELGDFATYDEAKSAIEKHKETISLCDYHLTAEYSVLKFNDDNDNNPTEVYNITMTEAEQDKRELLLDYATGECSSADIADIFSIDDDNKLADILTAFREEYKQLGSTDSWHLIIDKYRNMINELASLPPSDKKIEN